jgi:hypothetical protein
MGRGPPTAVSQNTTLAPAAHATVSRCARRALGATAHPHSVTSAAPVSPPTVLVMTSASAAERAGGRPSACDVSTPTEKSRAASPAAHQRHPRHASAKPSGANSTTLLMASVIHRPPQRRHQRGGMSGAAISLPGSSVAHTMSAALATHDHRPSVFTRSRTCAARNRYLSTAFAIVCNCMLLVPS